MRSLVVVLACAACSPAPPPTQPPASVSPLPSTPPRRDVWASAVLARSNATSVPPANAFKLVISKNAILLGDGTPLVPLPHDLFITPLAAAFKAQPARDALLAIDPSVPYRVVVEALFTLGKSDMASVHLLVRSSAGLASLEPKMPHVRPGSKPIALLALTVLIVDGGFSVKAMRGNIAPGCRDVGEGIAVPNKGGLRDQAALAECVARVKASSPELADEADVTIAANPDVDFQTIVTTMDTLRPTFPNVMFGIAK